MIQSTSLTSKEQASFISLALDALIENTYKCYEVMIISINTDISVFSNDPEKAKYCLNMDYSEFKREIFRFRKTCSEAKKSTGIKSETSCKAAIEAYNDAITIGESLLDNVDWIKVEDFGQHKMIAALQEKSSLQEKMIESLIGQMTKHRRGIALGFVVFVAVAFFNTVLKDFFDQMLIPYFWQLLYDKGFNLTAIYH